MDELSHLQNTAATFEEVSNSQPSHPLKFPEPQFSEVTRVNASVHNPTTNETGEVNQCCLTLSRSIERNILTGFCFCQSCGAKRVLWDPPRWSSSSSSLVEFTCKKETNRTLTLTLTLYNRPHSDWKLDRPETQKSYIWLCSVMHCSACQGGRVGRASW